MEKPVFLVMPLYEIIDPITGEVINIMTLSM